jgi:hypothetical protein
MPLPVQLRRICHIEGQPGLALYDSATWYVTAQPGCPEHSPPRGRLPGRPVFKYDWLNLWEAEQLSWYCGFLDKSFGVPVDAIGHIGAAILVLWFA